jgi:hypothetical protein
MGLGRAIRDRRCRPRAAAEAAQGRGGDAKVGAATGGGGEALGGEEGREGERSFGRALGAARWRKASRHIRRRGAGEAFVEGSCGCCCGGR